MTPTIEVLVVDDDPQYLELTQSYLAQTDPELSVSTAAGADEARSMLTADQFDCIVSDYQMPGTDGLELLEAVRVDHPELPFILFTGQGSEEIASEAISAGVTDYLRKQSGRERYEMLANRIRHAVERRQAQRRADDLAHINEVIRVVQQGLLRADTRSEIEQVVCASLTDAEPYRFAWIGVPDEESGELQPRASAGDGDGYLSSVTVRFDDTPEGRGPAGTAVRTHESQVVDSMTCDERLAPWQEAVEQSGFNSVIVLPLVHRDVLYGVLPLYSDRSAAFGEDERAVLEELADTIAKAIAAAETRRRLTQYETVVDAVGDAAYAVDAEECFTFVNDAFVELTGYDRETLLESHTALIKDRESTRRVEAAVDRFREGRVSEARLLVDVERADGTTVQCEDHMGTLPASGEESYVGRAGVLRVVSQSTSSTSYRQKVYEVSASGELDFEETCRELLRLGCERLGVAHGKLVQTDPDSNSHETVFSTTQAEEGSVKRLDRTFCRRVIDRGEYVAFHDAEATGWLGDPAEETHGHQCYVGTEVVVDGEQFGTVCFYDPEPRNREFDDAELTFLELVARSLGHEIERRRSTRSLERRAERLREVHRITADRSVDADEQIGDLLDLGREVLGTDYAILSKVSGDTYQIELLSGSRDGVEPGMTVPLSATLCQRTITHDSTLSVTDIQGTVEDGEHPVYAEFGVECYIGIPIEVDGSLYGTLCFLDEEPRAEPFDDWEQTFLELTSQWVSYTLEQQQHQEALARERDRLSEFASVVSHDLRNPLSVAAGRIDIAREEIRNGAPEAADDSLRSAEDAVERMDSLIDDTLALSRQGRSVGETDAIPLESTTRAAWDGLQTGGAELVVATTATVRADRERLEQLLTNLFRNSVEHGSTGHRPSSGDSGSVRRGSTRGLAAGEITAERSSTVTIEVGVLEAGDGFYVADNGEGIPESMRDRVFDRGFSTGEEGTGFGLNIVERIAEAHGWQVEITESATGGARFEFRGVEVD